MWAIENPESVYLSESQRAELRVLLDAIVPGHARTGMPSASVVGADAFVGRLLAMSERTHRDIPTWRDLYPKLLEGFDAVARQRFEVPLAELDAERAAELMADAQAARLADPFPSELDQRAIFAMLRGHCLQGCFGDPRWSGNRDGTMWKWLGYPATEESTR